MLSDIARESLSKSASPNPSLDDWRTFLQNLPSDAWNSGNDGRDLEPLMRATPNAIHLLTLIHWMSVRAQSLDVDWRTVTRCWELLIDFKPGERENISLLEADEWNKLGFIVRKWKNQFRESREDLMQLCSVLKRALVALPQNRQQMTPLHAIFAETAVVLKDYQESYHLVSHPILYMDKNAIPIQTLDILCYFYFAALICIANQKFKRAEVYLLNAMSIRCSYLSAIQLAAFKKYILIILLQLEVNEHPHDKMRLVSNSLGKFFAIAKTRASTYMNIVTMFCSCNVVKIEAEILRNQSSYQADLNLGLVKQVLRHKRHLIIQHSMKVYKSVSLEKIGVKINMLPEAVEGFLERMMADRKAQNIQLDKQSSYVHFGQRSDLKITWDDSRLNVLTERLKQIRRELQLQTTTQATRGTKKSASNSEKFKEASNQ